MKTNDKNDKASAPSTSSSGKIMSKLNDGLGLVSNSLSQGFVKAARLFSTEVMAKPKNAWPGNDVFELEGVSCPPHIVEAMFVREKKKKKNVSFSLFISFLHTSMRFAD